MKECYQHPEIVRLNDCRGRLECVRKNTECILIEMKEKEDEEISRLDQYYTIVFDFLERQRKAERRKIEEYYHQVFFRIFRKKLTLRLIPDKYRATSKESTK